MLEKLGRQMVEGSALPNRDASRQSAFVTSNHPMAIEFNPLERETSTRRWRGSEINGIRFC
jgi:hypothetical protein